MSADELRQAAATLRERASAAEQGPWNFETAPNGMSPLVFSERNLAVAETLDKPHLSDARYIATVHPGVGLALADWLDAEAAIYERLEAISMEVTPKGYTLSWPESTQAEAETLARLINGGAA